MGVVLTIRVGVGLGDWDMAGVGVRVKIEVTPGVRISVGIKNGVSVGGRPEQELEQMGLSVVGGELGLLVI